MGTGLAARGKNVVASRKRRSLFEGVAIRGEKISFIYSEEKQTQGAAIGKRKGGRGQIGGPLGKSGREDMWGEHVVAKEGRREPSLFYSSEQEESDKSKRLKLTPGRRSSSAPTRKGKVTERGAFRHYGGRGEKGRPMK